MDGAVRETLSIAGKSMGTILGVMAFLYMTIKVMARGWQ